MYLRKNIRILNTIRNTFTLIFLFVILSSFIPINNGKYHRVKAEYGDSIYSLLKRYHLDDYSCNFQQFYKLNNLSSDSRLQNGSSYYIPVLIYNYNGKSIKTTLGLKGWEDAIRIKKYNEKILRENLRSSTIVKSGIIWVPHHEMACADEKISPRKENDIVQNPTSPGPKAEELLIPDPKRLKKIPDESKEIVEERMNKQQKLNNVEPVASGYRRYPIFGKKHAFIPMIDNKLRGKVFYIVSGHGGPDSGAVGKHKGKQICEDEYAYDVSLRLTRYLLQHGALVYMITRDPDDGLRSGKYLKHDTDEYCWGKYKISRNQKTRLYQRSDAINTLYESHLSLGHKDQTVVTIHIDSRSKSQNTDVFFYYFPGSEAGKKLAKNMHKTFANKYKKYRSSGKYHGTVTARDLHMTREPKPNSVFVELGNIQNAYDQQRFMLETNREALAKWMYEGLIN